MLIKRRPSYFVENKYRHEHVMITFIHCKSYLVCLSPLLMHSMSLLCMLRRSMGIHLYPSPPCGRRCHCSTSWCSETWQLGRDTRHVPDRLEYLRGGRLEMVPEVQSKEYDMTSLQTVPSHIAGIGALFYWKKKWFPRV